jgi:type IV secretion system protein VirD4
VPKRDDNGEVVYTPRRRVIRKIKLLRDGKNTHLFGFCPTRSGKGVGMVIPTALTWRHSIVMNDPKGEAYALTAGFRKACGQDIIKFEPACTDGTGACWNPLDEIRIFTLHDVADAQMIMTMACDPKGKGLDDYFDKAGYEFLTAVALHVRYTSSEGSLGACANFLGDPNWDSDKQMYTEMMQATHDPEGKMGWTDSLGAPSKTHPMIANAAKTMLNKEDKDRSGVLSTAKSLLSLYLDPIVANNTSRSDFLARDLMMGEKAVSLYFVVQPPDMERLTPLTRLFYAICIRRNAADMQFEGGRSKATYKHRLLMVIDEAMSLQKLPILQEALSYVAGYGIRMFFLVQDIVQVEELYGDKQSFDSGAETRIAYAPNKIETAEKLARMTGKTTVSEEGASRSSGMWGFKSGSVSLSNNKTARDLVTADEFMSLHTQDMIVFVKGQPPIYGRKSFFYENPTLLERSKIAAPKESSRLRARPPAPDDAAAEIQVAQPETPKDKWAAGREAMRERIATVTQAQPAGAAASGAGQGKAKAAEGASDAQSDGNAEANPRLRSRYAERVRSITPEERRKVQELVASVGVVDKVINVSAF